MKRINSESSAYASWDASLALSTPWIEATHLGNVVSLAAGDVLAREGERHSYFYLLRSGFVHSTLQRSNGAEFLLEIFGPGAIFGEGPAFANRPRPTTTRVVAPAILSRYLPADITQKFSTMPELAASLIQLLGFKNQMVVEKLAGVASAAPKERVVDLLLRIARLQSNSEFPLTQESKNFQVDLTHEKIAAMTALSRVTVTRTLNLLSREGVIETRAKQVIIHDASALRRLHYKNS
ncbi:Crp/Fnr family transcriptional regulator [Variovorax sp. PAMC26660]|uniref:Crp/Fnr family transcriptional regulator n=1 Tax=Variovorax sp. PAMC26660 TaxID=2762322 RepID=UPI00164E5202|nr:Crp/Fnr family transcriptional regulator [Variovorax sp. PAMC26660]QNK71294.1 Crp/Fnr family transcriptional regulator [Variovorax sp. PAMC26660]